MNQIDNSQSGEISNSVYVMHTAADKVHHIYTLFFRFSLSVLTTIYPGEPGIAGFIGATDDGSGADNWSYKSCKAPVKSSPPTNQHPTFYRPDALPVAQPRVSKH